MIRVYSLKDVIHHEVYIRFNLWDRIKVMFGKQLIIKSQIYTVHENCRILGFDSETVISNSDIYKYKYF